MSTVNKKYAFFLHQEVDRIITQMMRAADYLGWDATELRPV